MFEPRKGISAQSLGQILYANFPGYIKGDAAEAKWGDRNYGNFKTARFHGFVRFPYLNPVTDSPSMSPDLAKPHSDWVAIEWLNPTTFSITVQTPQREFLDVEEDGPSAAGGAALGSVIGGVLSRSVCSVRSAVLLWGKA